jgi:ATP-binding cassette subfamily C protein CydC
VDFLAHLKSEGEAYGRAQKQMAQVSGLSSAAGVMFSGLGLWGVLALSIPLVSSRNLDGVMLAVLALMAQASFEAVLPLPLAFQLLSSSLSSAQRLFEVVERDEKINLVVEPGITNFRPVSHSSINISGLTFTYPGSVTPALQDVRFDLSEGKKVAIVGPSGAGKSTLLNLLLRFWEAPVGSIRVAGRDLLEIPEEAARAMFSVISQRTYLFNATIRENLLLANPAAGQEEIEQAVQQAGIQDFISSLPKGYETMTGERGLRLSGGERQRLAIARALLKNAPIFLLDEPTTNLDPLTAKAILDHILHLAGSRSLLLITHRLVGLEGMDEIIVLENGCEVERGTQETLLRGGGLYRRMVDLQNRFLDEIPK